MWAIADNKETAVELAANQELWGNVDAARRALYPERMDDALSPLDCRYRDMLADLRPLMNEQQLFRQRIRVECEYLLMLSEHPQLPLRAFTAEEQQLLHSLYQQFDDNGFQRIRQLEQTTRHDVKAVEYFVKEQLADTSLSDSLEWVHFALTSEDINNVAYSLMLQDGTQLLQTTLQSLLGVLQARSETYRHLPMLARTHGQPATPTTFGLQFHVFTQRLQQQLVRLENHQLLGKFSGATGGYNAHLVAFPDVDWVEVCGQFVQQFGLQHNPWTTQIEPHDSWVDLFSILQHVNSILLDFDADMWRYISDGWMTQQAKAGEVGSSAMPHKVNPIQFENSEGNLRIANALLACFQQTLPVSRLQRDLTDSTVQRNFAVAYGHCLLGYRSAVAGLERVAVNEPAVVAELQAHPEVLAEAIQTILRVQGYAAPYELLKEWTRGQQTDLAALQQLIDGLSVNAATKEQLLGLLPEQYIGLADQFS